MTVEKQVAAHYGREDLGARLLAALAAAGKNAEALDLEDLAPIDEFHVRGRAATAELGRGLALKSHERVLDLGSGLGGPSRRLAAAHGCAITGIDLTEDYCRAARMLAARVGLAERVAYACANALALPFAAGAFAAAYTEHVAMNIPDKGALYREAARVLAPGGRFAIYDILQGPGGPPRFPVPWAATPATSFLATPEALREDLAQAGFTVEDWRDTTPEARSWFEDLRARTARDGPPPVGLHLLLGPVFAEMAQNMARNLAEGRVVLAQVVCRRG